MEEQLISSKLQVWIDKQEIYDLVCRYCRGVDRLDRELMLACYHPDATEQRGFFNGPAAEFCDFATATLATIVSSQHLIGNALIEVEGDIAFGEIYLTAHHRLIVDGDEKDLFVGSRYVDRYERRDGAWKIAFRTELHDWTRTDDATEDWTRANPSALMSRRGKDDLIMRKDDLRTIK